MEWGLPGLSLERGKGRKKIEEGPDPPPRPPASLSGEMGGPWIREGLGGYGKPGSSRGSDTGVSR